MRQPRDFDLHLPPPPPTSPKGGGGGGGGGGGEEKKKEKKRERERERNFGCLGWAVIWGCFLDSVSLTQWEEINIHHTNRAGAGWEF